MLSVKLNTMMRELEYYEDIQLFCFRSHGHYGPYSNTVFFINLLFTALSFFTIITRHAVLTVSLSLRSFTPYSLLSLHSLPTPSCPTFITSLPPLHTVLSLQILPSLPLISLPS